MRASFDIYLITDGAEPAQLTAAVAAALAGVELGRVAVQLRAKQLDTRALFELATELRALTLRHQTPLLINDRVDIARAVNADGVHLPERGLPVHDARVVLGPNKLIGVSCHDAVGLARAAQAAADFATLSPVFESPGKGAPLGLESFARLARASELPIYALGGITPDHAAELRAAGASGMAMISYVFGAADRGAALTKCLNAWRSARAKG